MPILAVDVNEVSDQVVELEERRCNKYTFDLHLQMEAKIPHHQIVDKQLTKKVDEYGVLVQVH